MTGEIVVFELTDNLSQSAFVRGFIDDPLRPGPRTHAGESQSAFVRGFIDDAAATPSIVVDRKSQSAFVRGFIDDVKFDFQYDFFLACLNPRSCAASSMT